MIGSQLASIGPVYETVAFSCDSQSQVTVWKLQSRILSCRMNGLNVVSTC
jgi:hypothetical protein